MSTEYFRGYVVAELTALSCLIKDKGEMHSVENLINAAIDQAFNPKAKIIPVSGYKPCSNETPGKKQKSKRLK